MAVVSALPMNPLAPRITTFSVTAYHPSSSLGLEPVTGETGVLAELNRQSGFTTRPRTALRSPFRTRDDAPEAATAAWWSHEADRLVSAAHRRGVEAAAAQLLLKAATRYAGAAGFRRGSGQLAERTPRSGSATAAVAGAGLLRRQRDPVARAHSRGCR